MPYLGNTPSTSFATVVKDSFSGDGSTVAFTLSKVATTNSVSVFVENVRQEPTTAYAVSGTTLTFTAAPVTSSGNNIYVLHMNPTTTTTHPSAQALTATSGTFSGILKTDDTTDATSTTDGSFQTDGGLSVAKDAVIGDDLTLKSDSAVIKFGADADVTLTHIADTGLRIANPTGADLELTTNSQAGSSGSPLNMDINFKGFSNNVMAIIRSHDESSSTGHGELQFHTTKNGVGTTEKVKIDHDGVFYMGSMNNVFSATGRQGINLFQDGSVTMSATTQPLYVNRDASDGNLVRFFHDTNLEGNINVSGNTVAYNGFSGSHWSRLADNSKPTILKGTVVETIDEMCDWYQVEYEVGGETHTSSISLPNGKKVGDTISFTVPNDPILHDQETIGKTFSGKIVKEKDNKHVKCKISDTADSTSVYGVFSDWDNDDDAVNDMYVTALGSHVVRIHKDQTVSKGDLITSNGDGTAKKQDDDIIRSKTIGKVLTNIKQETYSDGSYTVPCSLYCG